MSQKYRKKPVEIEAVQYLKYGCLVKGMCNSRSCYSSGNNKPHVHPIHHNQIVNLEIGDWIKKEVTCWLLRSDSAQVAIDRISFDSFRSSFRQPTNLDLLLRVNPIKKGAFEKWKASVIKMQGEGSRSSARAVKALIDSCKVDIELPDSSVDLANGWTALKEAYPMLPLVIGNYSYDSINYNKAVNDYVNLIDGNK